MSQPRAKLRPALFLDRDGVINTDFGYVHKQSEFEFIDGIFELVRSARANGYLIVVITNQAGIGRGYYSEEVFHSLNDWMCSEFESHRAPIDAVYFSPFHPVFGIGEYKKNSDTRKPGPGMLFQARDDLDIDLAHSVIIGDKLSDIEAGKAAGLRTLILFNTDSINKDGDDTSLPHVIFIRSLRDANAHL